MVDFSSMGNLAKEAAQSFGNNSGNYRDNNRDNSDNDNRDNGQPQQSGSGQSDQSWGDIAQNAKKAVNDYQRGGGQAAYAEIGDVVKDVAHKYNSSANKDPSAIGNSILSGFVGGGGGNRGNNVPDRQDDGSGNLGGSLRHDNSNSHNSLGSYGDDNSQQGQGESEGRGNGSDNNNRHNDSQSYGAAGDDYDYSGNSFGSRNHGNNQVDSGYGGRGTTQQSSSFGDSRRGNEVGQQDGDNNY